MTDHSDGQAPSSVDSLVEHLPVGVFRSTHDGEIVDVNEAFVSLLEAGSEEELLAHGAAEFYADPDRRQELVERLEREGTVVDEEVELVTLAGNRIWVSTTLILRESDSERFLEGITQDVTHRKERERELQRYRGMVDAMQDSVCIYDEDGRFVVVNEYLADFYGTTKGALEGTESRLVEQLRTNAGDERDPFERLVTGEIEAYRGEIEGDYPGHGHAIVDYRLTRLTVDGRLEGIVAVGREATERRQRERELKRTNERLDEFASVVSHDLRNPLGVAEGRLQLAREECDSAHLDHVARAHDRMDALIEDLLALAREDGSSVETAPVDLAEVAEASWRNVRTDDAALDTETAAVVHADRGRLQQLFENLFRNAVEHGSADSRTGSGDSVEHGSTGSRPQGGDSAEQHGPGVRVTVGDLDGGFYVEDDGPGIDPGDRERVFETGYSTSETGTGFGLAIVESVAQSHGWDVTVAEGSDGGARFEFTGVEHGS
jgi:PAS domain S-box-containing protein